MNQQRPSTSTFNQFKSGPGALNGGVYGPNMNINPPPPPPLPPRPSINNSYQPYGGFRQNYMGGFGGYGSYGNNNWGYGRYGSYGGYGGSYPYSSGYGQFGGPSGDVETRLVQFAEESSRPAFQSIESIINTFSSITMMLESTFFAMTSSFRAILSVAENVGRVRSMFGQLLSTFALIRFAKWLYKKIMYKLGLSANDPNADKVWKQTVLDVVNGEKTGPITWPILMFLGLLFVIPYLIHKLVKNVQVRNNENDPKEWFKLNEPVYSATAGYDFVASSQVEMSLKAGQKIWLAPQSLQPKNLPGWSKATDSVNVGLVPSNYITIVGEMKKKSDTINSPQPNERNINAMMEECFDNERKNETNDTTIMN
ncbi:hypothetical protein PV328_001532 [Microctonus aethiopoides]|uniref:Peroxisomal membrane protein PEX13 n=1 Tax=Microctonus aethiopoides TaxID=144406 RepID=A0AA39FX52_9HYME|nr:hypothetical protein PV328_001532 [Microctonus aethiopoides]